MPIGEGKMASKGKKKFDKYFLGKKEVKTFAKAKNNEPIPVYKDVTGTKKLDNSLLDKHPILVYPGKEYSSRYYVSYEIDGEIRFGYLKDENVGKPNVKKLNLTSTKILEEGGVKPSECEFLGQTIKCYKFDDYKTFAKIVFKGLTKIIIATNHTNITKDDIFQIFSPWLNGNFNEIRWNKSLPVAYRNEIGNYVGEILIGLIALAGKEKEHLDFVPWGNEEIKEFWVPYSSSFQCLDSILITKQGEIYPISNKYEKGAKASFFTNILSLGIEKANCFESSIFKELIETAKSLNIASKDLKESSRKGFSKRIVYEYGIRKILMLNAQTISNTYEIYKKLLRKEKDEEIEKIVGSIKEYLEKWEDINQKTKNNILKKLPNSVTSFFSRVIAYKLNNCTKSKYQMLKILSEKNFWQAHLSKKDWLNGKVKYRLLKSSKANIKIVGDKASTGDLECSNGMINFELSYNNNC